MRLTLCFKIMYQRLVTISLQEPGVSEKSNKFGFILIPMFACVFRRIGGLALPCVPERLPTVPAPLHMLLW